MNIYGSLMDIFDQKNKNIFDKKIKTFMSKKRINDFPSKIAQVIFC